MMKPILLDLPMPIRTPRLLIKPREIGEGASLAKAVNESLETLKPWMPFAQRPATPEDMEAHCREKKAEFILRKDFVLSIYLRDKQTLIGSTGFHRLNWDVPALEIGYWIHKNFEGKGLISESTNALTRYAFEVFKAKRVEIRCDAENLRSLSL